MNPHWLPAEAVFLSVFAQPQHCAHMGTFGLISDDSLTSAYNSVGNPHNSLMEKLAKCLFSHFGGYLLGVF